VQVTERFVKEEGLKGSEKLQQLLAEMHSIPDKVNIEHYEEPLELGGI
jgi:hypothetical protein